MENKLTVSYFLRCDFSIVWVEKCNWRLQRHHNYYDSEVGGEVECLLVIEKINKKWFLLCNGIITQLMNIGDLAFYCFIENKSKSFVYVIKSHLGYKIGKTTNLDNRNYIFNVKLPFEWEFEKIYTVLDCTYIETFLHNKLKNKKINGEWFDLTERDLKLIGMFIVQAQESL